MGRGLWSGIWDVEAAIYTGPRLSADLMQMGIQRTEAALRAARAEAERNGWLVSIAIVDKEGEPLGLLKLDGSPPNSAQCAIKKAQRATSLKHYTLDEETRSVARSEHIRCSAGAASIYVDAKCIAAIGVDGANPVESTQLAKTAAEVFVEVC